MNPLEKKLQKQIQEHGAMRLDVFMEAALYDAEHGYYTTQHPFSDFVTAPELTPLFGEALTVWVVQRWQEMGSPEKWQLLECGAGQGTLMSDMVRTLMQIAPDCARGCRLVLLEISERLKKVQREKLSVFEDIQLQWCSDILEVPNDMPTILVANEFLDAFPVRQFQKVDDVFQERFVTCGADGKFQFVWQLAEEMPFKMPEGEGILEVSEGQVEWLKTFKNHFSGQALCSAFIDYAIAGGDTLQALKKHAFASPLQDVGEADLTTHVHFPFLREAADMQGEILDMNTFLTQHGLPLRVQMLMEKSPQHRDELMRVAERLLSPEHMGVMFKCWVV